MRDGCVIALLAGILGMQAPSIGVSALLPTGCIKKAGQTLVSSAWPAIAAPESGARPLPSRSASWPECRSSHPREAL